MPSTAKVTFEENRKDIEQFWTIHEKAAGKGKGRKHKVEVLNRAVIVFVCACWEAYVEDVLRDALNALLAAASAPASSQKDLNRPLEHALASFHTPNTRGVVNLVEGTLGLAKLSKAWKWAGQPAHDATGKKLSKSDELDALVRLRGRIAHKVAATTPIRKRDGTKALKLVQNLVTKTDAAIASHLQPTLGKPPW